MVSSLFSPSSHYEWKPESLPCCLWFASLPICTPCSNFFCFLFPSSSCSSHATHCRSSNIQAHSHLKAFAGAIISTWNPLPLIFTRSHTLPSQMLLNDTLLGWLSLNNLPKIASFLPFLSPTLTCLLLSIYYCQIHDVLFCLLFTFCLPLPPLERKIH